MRKKSLILLAIGISLTLCSVPVAAKDTVKVAFISPLTGGVSAIGVGGRNSAELAVRLKNADPKAKYKYELLVLDDECKPNIGVQVATKAAADKQIIAAATHYCSVVALACVDVYHKFGLPVVVWGAVHPDITYGHNHKEIFRVNGTMINQNDLAAKFVASLGYKTWALLHDTTDYGKGMKDYFSKYLTAAGGKIVGVYGVNADQQDFTAELTQIKQSNPDVIWFGGLTPLGVRIRLQMARLGNESQFQSCSGIISDAYIEGTGKLGEGTLAFREGEPVEHLPGGKWFMAEYGKAGYKEAPDAFGPFAFSAMNLVLEAIEKVGPNRKAVTEYLRKVKDHQAIIGAVTFDDHGQNINPSITRYVVQDGKWVPWQESLYASGKRQLKRLP
ncbi:MAG: branched-chain amino acid ABC transporter substrate-binding protein [Deltaproteobacteria bacterium]|jgi:branched-chain amino acid transport system substrate-binding protein|nr:branched-chain amino acid ABC transporter substrate-binding protein [Deltaproteobacteria bacterium]